MLRKVYVKSGQLQWLGLAKNPLDAVSKALQKGVDGITLDAHYFYVDERGFRMPTAEWKVPLSMGLAHAGFLSE